jgi:hypothetical protein
MAVSDLNDADLVRRERAWNQKTTTWIWVAGAALGVITTPLAIRFIKSHPGWTDTELFLAILAVGVVLSIPVGIWTERERRRQPAAIFGPRAAALQIDHLQHRLGRALAEFAAVSVVMFLCQEAVATGRFGRPFVAGEAYGPYWIVVVASIFTTVRTARSLSRRGWVPAKTHPYMQLAMQDERVQAARLEAIRRAYPVMVGAVALAYGVVAIDPDWARYALPVVLLLVVAIPALFWRAAMRDENAAESG